MDIQLGLSYTDDRVLQTPQVLLLNTVLALSKGPEIINTKVTEQALIDASAHCATQANPGFACIFEIGIKDGIEYRYIKTPSAATVLRTLLEAGYAIPGSW